MIKVASAALAAGLILAGGAPALAAGCGGYVNIAVWGCAPWDNNKNRMPGAPGYQPPKAQPPKAQPPRVAPGTGINGNNLTSGRGNLIGQAGGNVIAPGGGNVIAPGGGNVIAPGGGNLTSRR